MFGRREEVVRAAPLAQEVLLINEQDRISSSHLHSTTEKKKDSPTGVVPSSWHMSLIHSCLIIVFFNTGYMQQPKERKAHLKRHKWDLK